MSPRMCHRITTEISSVSTGSAMRQPKAQISAPPSSTATDTAASARLCRNAARMFTLSLASRIVSHAVPRSITSAKAASAMTSPPCTSGGSARRPNASTISHSDTAISVM